ncbi:unnamed protein product, partial [Mesorhabditis belari]|uniref:Uncharacterized protein n=1 Tax=Mesorhabditis belari TaxID=2138241 RepID=A0AAF3J2K8_9BILA
MARHSKIPKKNRKKLKSVDPYNTKGNVIKEREMEKKNCAPKEKDEQGMSNLLMEIGKSQSQLAFQESIPSFPRKKAHKNRIDAEAARYGYERKQFESPKMFLNRISMETHKQVNDISIKAKFELAGRAKEEIDKDYKEIDDKIERRRELKRKRSEKILALKRAEKGLDEEDEPSEEEEEAAHMVKSTTPSMTKASSKKDKKAQRNEELKKIKKDKRLAIQKESLLTAKEIVPFGERYDAPPKFEFNSKLKIDMTKRMAKAGSKDLKLKALLQNRGEEKETIYQENEKISKDTGSKITEADRQRVIDMYREAKRQKRQKESE